MRANWSRVSTMSASEMLRHCEEIAKMPILDIKEKFGRELYLQEFFKGVGERLNSLQVPEIAKISETLVKHVELRSCNHVGSL